MEVFILSFMDSAYSPHPFWTELGVFSTEEGAMAAAEEDAGHPLPWEKKVSDRYPHHALRDGDKKGAFYYTQRMRVQ
jgi:hypothetical protein